MTLPGFEEWIKREGFVKIFSYWSINEEQAPQGTEGILILSKVPCTATYGVGVEGFDRQARVVTLEFPEIFIIISYNPQGGLKSHSLEYRAKWEKSFEEFLKGMKEKSERTGKKIIWAGDFNVNPEEGDFSERAFDNIRHKIPRGTIPAGCREEDRQAYRRMVEAIEGKNLGDVFGRNRTWFPNEFCLQKNFGQRIDHVVAQQQLLDSGGPIQIQNFAVAKEFGGGRRFVQITAHYGSG